MNLAALFSLISAAILGLLPVLLLFGRRRMQRRTGSTEPAEPTKPVEPSDPVARATGREDAQSGERPILDRLARDRREEPNGRNRELREAAIIAGASPAVASTAVARGGRASTDPAPRRERQPLERRLARLSPLQRAVAYSEILGPPAALRRPGRRDEL